MLIEINYDGEYPNLCRGKLIVIIDNAKYEFPDYCLSSGGEVSFDDNWSEIVTKGNWSIDKWPDNAIFTKEMKKHVLKEVNAVIPKGCCGGCV